MSAGGGVVVLACLASARDFASIHLVVRPALERPVAQQTHPNRIFPKALERGRDETRERSKGERTG